jgi:hypothetical protein
VLDGDAARVERDALPDEGPQLVPLGRAPGLVAQDDERGLLLRALADAEQPPHAARANLFDAERLDRQAELAGHLGGAARELARR